MKKLWTRVKETFHRLRYTEPALLRAYYVQAGLVLASLGLTIPGVIDEWAGVALSVLAIAAPYYQGRKTRADVWSQQTVDDLIALVALFPDLAEKARELLGKGLPTPVVHRQLELLSIAADPPGQHASKENPLS